MKKTRKVRTASLLAAAAVLAACGSDSSGPSYDTLVITTNSLAPAVISQPYQAGVDAEGGDEAYQWDITAGSLPPGLDLTVEDLTDDDVLITGTAATEGSYTFTLRVRSGDGQSASREFTVDVIQATALTILNALMPPALQGAPYDVTLSAVGGDGQSYTWTLASGSLPAGLSLTGNRIQGTPSALDTTSFTLQASSGGETTSRTFTIGVVPHVTGAYNITTLRVSSVPASIEPALLDAVARWEAAITGDLIGGQLPTDFFGQGTCGGFGPSANGTTIDDLLLLVNIAPIDGSGAILGQAGPCAIRGPDDGQLPVVGVLTLDQDDLEDLVPYPDALEALLAHEIGHVLGFGSMWDNFSLVTGAGTNSPRFTGPQAVSEYQALGGSGQVPVEEGGGEGTADVHWNEETFDNEMMTGFAESPTAPVPLDMPLSRVSIASMGDLGYQVDLTTADPYSLPALAGYGTFRDSFGRDLVLDEEPQVLETTFVPSTPDAQ
jgi:hypothetical protein